MEISAWDGFAYFWLSFGIQKLLQNTRTQRGSRCRGDAFDPNCWHIRLFGKLLRHNGAQRQRLIIVFLGYQNCKRVSGASFGKQDSVFWNWVELLTENLKPDVLAPRIPLHSFSLARLCKFVSDELGSTTTARGYTQSLRFEVWSGGRMKGRVWFALSTWCSSMILCHILYNYIMWNSSTPLLQVVRLVRVLSGSSAAHIEAHWDKVLRLVVTSPKAAECAAEVEADAADADVCPRYCSSKNEHIE